MQSAKKGARSNPPSREDMTKVSRADTGTVEPNRGPGGSLESHLSQGEAECRVSPLAHHLFSYHWTQRTACLIAIRT